MNDFTCHIVGCVQDPGHDPPHHDYRGREIPEEDVPVTTAVEHPPAPSAYEVGGVRMEFPPIESDEARRRWALEQAVLCYAQPHLYPVKENLLHLADEFIAYVTQEVTQEPKG